jgi:hypothetical protein
MDDEDEEQVIYPDRVDSNELAEAEEEYYNGDICGDLSNQHIGE